MSLDLSKQVYKPRRKRRNLALFSCIFGKSSEKGFPATGDNINTSLLCSLVTKVHFVSRNVEIL